MKTDNEWWRWADVEQPVGTDSRFVRDTLILAGWYPGRSESARVAAWAELLARDTSYPEGGIKMFTAAREALLEFGGLESKNSGAGFHFARASFRIDPELVYGEGDRIDDLAQDTGSQLYPLGDVDGGVVFLAMDEQGWVYLSMNDVQLLAKSMHEAIGCLVLGRKAAS